MTAPGSRQPARPVRNQRGLSRMLTVLPLPLGFVLGLGVTALRSLAPGNPGHFERRGGYRLVQPLLDYEVARQIEQKAPLLKYHVQRLINTKIQTGHVAHVSVYFRDLHNGPWFGIHEKELFAPASLLKVPILMTYLKQAESDPALLSRHLTYQGNVTLPAPRVKPSSVIREGTPYAVEELLTRMIASSDNRATAALVNAIDPEALNRTFSELGLSIPNFREPDDLIAVKAYAGFFRILFNATYLSPEMSEKALELLTKVEFTQGLVAGVPSNVVVAHKFGERGSADGKTNQLHDCGIVYAPGRPYLLCVMTRGQQVDELVGTIREISHLVYQELAP